jgi:hypothetical protein
LVLEPPIMVFLTAFATTSFKKHLFSFGVRHVYEKPITKEQLLKILKDGSQ